MYNYVLQSCTRLLFTVTLFLFLRSRVNLIHTYIYDAFDRVNDAIQFNSSILNSHSILGLMIKSFIGLRLIQSAEYIWCILMQP